MYRRMIEIIETGHATGGCILSIKNQCTSTLLVYKCSPIDTSTYRYLYTYT